MSKDIKKALEHCIEWDCADCPNREELGSGETVCRGRLLPEVLEYVADLEAKLAEKERQYETLYKLFSEQHEIIDQYELECFEEVNRLLKEQKDFYIVEKTEYDKMKQGAKDIVKELKQQLAKKDEQLRAKIGSMKSNDFIKMCLQCGLMIDAKEKDNQDKILFAIEQLEKVKGLIANHTQELWTCENDDIDVVLYEEIDNQIKELKGEK